MHAFCLLARAGRVVAVPRVRVSLFAATLGRVPPASPAEDGPKIVRIIPPGDTC